MGGGEEESVNLGKRQGDLGEAGGGVWGLRRERGAGDGALVIGLGVGRELREEVGVTLGELGGGAGADLEVRLGDPDVERCAGVVRDFSRFRGGVVGVEFERGCGAVGAAEDESAKLGAVGADGRQSGVTRGVFAVGFAAQDVLPNSV